MLSAIQKIGYSTQQNYTQRNNGASRIQQKLGFGSITKEQLDTFMKREGLIFRVGQVDAEEHPNDYMVTLVKGPYYKINGKGNVCHDGALAWVEASNTQEAHAKAKECFGKNLNLGDRLSTIEDLGEDRQSENIITVA